MVSHSIPVTLMRAAANSLGTSAKQAVSGNVYYAYSVYFDSESEYDSARRANKRKLLRSERERFWGKVNTRGPIPIDESLGPCWLWTASTTRGYGQFALSRELSGRQQHLYAHRLAYELINGALPSADLKVCHRCDEPLCVRPSHLFAGSQRDNLKDARAKGRLDNTRPRTTDKLTPDDRIAIFNAPRDRKTGGELARRFGVSKTCICAIRKGRFVRTPLHRVFERVVSIQIPIRGDLLVSPSVTLR